MAAPTIQHHVAHNDVLLGLERRLAGRVHSHHAARQALQRMGGRQGGRLLRWEGKAATGEFSAIRCWRPSAGVQPCAVYALTLPTHAEPPTHLGHIVVGIALQLKGDAVAQPGAHGLARVPRQGQGEGSSKGGTAGQHYALLDTRLNNRLSSLSLHAAASSPTTSPQQHRPCASAPVELDVDGSLRQALRAVPLGHLVAQRGAHSTAAQEETEAMG